ncbi:putative tenascin-R [Apostichopus japonicus]|uniref:Putative tenascin-R n=1 Tax=Stichopus japonicus TaxID=307972 RepID=A0A2G8LBU1_STIJA|nr:putative tenascin-R [Apostichopus japonicus]
MTRNSNRRDKNTTEYRQVNEHGEHKEIDVRGLEDMRWREERKKPTGEEKEFWLGNEKLAHLTAQKNYELRIDFRNKHGDPYYATFDHFRVGDSGNNYHLLLGVYSGNSGDGAFTYHMNMSFSTIDADHDESQSNCAATQRGGWWFNNCDQTNLNGRYGLDDDTGGIEWNSMPGVFRTQIHRDEDTAVITAHGRYTFADLKNSSSFFINCYIY